MRVKCEVKRASSIKNENFVKRVVENKNSANTESVVKVVKSIKS